MATFSRATRLEQLLARVQRLIDRGTSGSSRFTKWRLGIFIAGALCSVTLFRSGWYSTGNLVLAGFVVLFLIVAAYHNSLEHRIHRLRIWHQIKSVHLARVRLDWTTIPQKSVDVPSSHLYALDLDLIGPHSLLHLIDNTVSDQGRLRLNSWLLKQPPDTAAWAARQRLVKKLKPRSLFRDRLVLEAHLAGEHEINGRRLEAALNHPVGFPHLETVLIVQSLLALTTIFLVTGTLLDWFPGYWMFSFALYAMIYFMTDQGEELLEHAVGLHHEMEQLSRVLRYLERHARGSLSALADVCRPLLVPGKTPSSLTKQVARVLHGISIKAHPLVHLGFNAICPWDLFFTFRLKRFQRRIQAELPVWLDRLAEVEAASALATFAYLHPSFVWPQPGTRAGVTAGALGHPLIPPHTRIANDLDISGLGTIHLITGSNMSGKSTFLRTIGINVCLAQAGAPVCATRFEWSWSRIGCCLRINDSLDAGLSFFYAEVKRLKALLAATEDKTAPPILFLIDEIFKGTNNRERLIGSRAYIKALSKGNGFGLVSTHDLELTDLQKEISSLTNAHFQEIVADGALEFDYTLRPGPCPTTNALRIMELEGLPVPLPDKLG
ncbi:MutS family DNA mismatch repair protein [Petrachloros mirabilis]